MSPACPRVRPLLAEFALDVLEPSEFREVEEHLDECGGCRKEAEGFREGAARLALGVPTVRPHPELVERVVAKAAAARTSELAEAPPASAARRRFARRASGRTASRRVVRMIAAAGLAAAILAGASFGWAIAMRGQVQDLKHARAQSERTVKELRQFIADFQKTRVPMPVPLAEKSKVFGALMVPPAGRGGSGELLVVSVPGPTPDFVHMQANLSPTVKGPFRVFFQQGSGEPIAAGGLVKTADGDYVLSTDPRFFDLDLSHLTGVIVLDKLGTTLLTGAIQLITAPTA